jgi:hypothetical protein
MFRLIWRSIEGFLITSCYPSSSQSVALTFIREHRGVLLRRVVVSTHARKHTRPPTARAHTHTQNKNLFLVSLCTQTHHILAKKISRKIESVLLPSAVDLRCDPHISKQIFSWPLTLSFHRVESKKSGALSSSDIGKQVVASRVSREFLGTDLDRSVCRRCGRLHKNYHYVLIITKSL